MLINIGLKDYIHDTTGMDVFESMVGLEVEKVDERIVKLLTPILEPTQKSVSNIALDVVDHVISKMEQRDKEIKVRNKEIEEWYALFATLSDEEKDFYNKENYVRIFPDKKTPPRPIDNYNGVFINRDVPPYYIYELVGAFRSAGIAIYFPFSKPKFKEVSTGHQADDYGTGVAVSHVKQVFDGYSKHQICLTYQGNAINRKK